MMLRHEEKKRAEMAKLAEAIGEMEVASEEDIAAARQSATKTGARRNEGEDAPEPEENTTPVVGLREGAWVRVEGYRAVLGGRTGCRVLRRGQEPLELEAGADLAEIL